MMVLALLVALLFAIGWQQGQLPTLLLFGYGVMSLLTFISYGRDKHAARNGRRRTPEHHLQLLALAGGWPGALLAMPLFHHKRRKASFLLGFWLVTLLNGGVLAGWLVTR